MIRMAQLARHASLVAGLGLWASQANAQNQTAFVPDNGAPAAQTQTAQPTDITAPYTVAPQAGTWMICAASYSGPYAPQLAVKLTEYIRSRHQVPVYIFNHANEERRHMAEEWERSRQAAAAQGIPLPQRRRIVRVEEQCAVLIGGPGAGWAEMDAATRFLKTVKRWPLPDIKAENGVLTHDEVWDIGPGAGGNFEVKNKVAVNPFATSFVIRNPTVPHAARPQNKYDPAWEKFNKYESFNLLKCPKSYTLAVREYIGSSTVQPRMESNGFLDKIGLGSQRLGDGLSAAGCQAHELAEFLKKLGFQPYVLHTRTSSVVTVGAFESTDDPELGRTQDRLRRFSFKGQHGEPIDLGLFCPAVPIAVPRP